MKRRSFLALGCALSVSGCSMVSERVPVEQGAMLEGVEIMNRDRAEYSVNVTVSDNDEVVHREQVSVSAFEHREEEPSVLGAGRVTCEWPATPAPYTIETVLEDDAPARMSFDRFGEDDCYYVSFVINGGSINPSSRESCERDLPEQCWYYESR